MVWRKLTAQLIQTAAALQHLPILQMKCQGTSYYLTILQLAQINSGDTALTAQHQSILLLFLTF